MAKNTTLEDITNIVGISATIKLSARYGGKKIFIPHKSALKESHTIVETIGKEAARKLSAEFPRETLDIPIDATLDKLRIITLFHEKIKQCGTIDIAAEQMGFSEYNKNNYLKMLVEYGMIDKSLAPTSAQSTTVSEKELGEDLGYSGFSALISAYAGNIIHINNPPQSALINILGESGANKLAEKHGGKNIHIPPINWMVAINLSALSSQTPKNNKIIKKISEKISGDPAKSIV